jgi:hypothetical protein
MDPEGERVAQDEGDVRVRRVPARKALSMVAGKRGDDLRDLVDLEDRGWRVITNLDPQR